MCTLRHATNKEINVRKGSTVTQTSLTSQFLIFFQAGFGFHIGLTYFYQIEPSQRIAAVPT